MLHVDAIENALEIRDEVQGELKEGEKIYLTILDKPKLPAILACVETWGLQGFPERVTMESFPGSPRKESHDLIDWLWLEILNVYTGVLEVPNE